MSLKVKGFEVNMFGEMTYVVWDTASHEAAIIDAGMISKSEAQTIDSFISEEGLSVKYLINTHLHIDHVFGVPHIKGRYGIGLSASEADSILASRIEEQIKMFHLPVEAPDIDIAHPLADGDILKLGEEEITVIGVPGHSPGGLAFYAPEAHFVITGDSLFNRSIGRTDLPGGNHSTLVKAVTEKLLTLPGNTRVYPGHGPSTTIDDEIRFNPFL